MSAALLTFPTHPLKYLAKQKKKEKSQKKTTIPSREERNANFTQRRC